eukprot:684268_1
MHCERFRDIWRFQSIVVLPISSIKQCTLQSMLTIVKQNKLESRNEQNKEESHDDANDDVREVTPTTLNQLHFKDIVPDPIVGHICSFLGPSDVETLRVSSRQIAIQCLKHQQLIPIRTFDTKQLLNTSESLIDYYPFVTHSTVTRYHPKCKSNFIFCADQLVCVKYPDSGSNLSVQPRANTSLDIDTLYISNRGKWRRRPRYLDSPNDTRDVMIFMLVPKSTISVMDDHVA